MNALNKKRSKSKFRKWAWRSIGIIGTVLIGIFPEQIGKAICNFVQIPIICSRPAEEKKEKQPQHEQQNEPSKPLPLPPPARTEVEKMPEKPEAKVPEEAGVGAPEKKPNGEPPAFREALKTVEEGGFIFKAISCKRSGGKTICIISVQNEGANEKWLKINNSSFSPSDSSYIYDDLGNQYRISLVGIGKQVGSDVQNTFVPQVPVNVKFIAEDIQSEATHATLSIGIWGGGFNKLVVIKDIPISK